MVRSIIITPLTLINQWILEIMRATQNKFKVIDFHKKKKNRYSKREWETADIILSTPDTFSRNVLQAQRHWDDYSGTYYYSFNRRYKDSPNQFRTGFFSRIIMDECHDIKNGERAR